MSVLMCVLGRGLRARIDVVIMYFYLIFAQIHLEFIQVCMQQLQIIYESLQQYKPGEIEQEPPEVQQGCKAEVCLRLVTLNVVEHIGPPASRDYPSYYTTHILVLVQV